MTHFRILETWRLMAAIAVMAYHFLRFGPEGKEEIGDYLYRFLPLMEMFFIISGFLIMLRYADTLLVERGSWRRFILRRVARLYPVYLVTLAFFGAVGLAVSLGIVSSNDPGRYDFSAFIYNLLLVQGWGFTGQLTFNYVGWTLSAEWFCYLLLPVVMLSWRIGGLGGIAFFCAAILLALEAATRYGIIPFDTWMEANTWGAYRAFGGFALGALLAVLVREWTWTIRSHVPAWAAFALSIAAMATGQNPYMVLLLLCLSVLFAAIAEENAPERSSYLAPLGPFGRVSFGIYMLHPVVETLFFSLLWRMAIEPAGLLPFYAYWLMPAVVTVALALASDRWFEGPVARWLLARGGVGGRASAPAAGTSLAGLVR